MAIPVSTIMAVAACDQGCPQYSQRYALHTSNDHTAFSQPDGIREESEGGHLEILKWDFE